MIPLNWEKAEILSISENGIQLKTLKGINGVIPINKIRWAVVGKKISDQFKIGDIILVKKEKKDWDLKQYPE